MMAPSKALSYLQRLRVLLLWQYNGIVAVEVVAVAVV